MQIVITGGAGFIGSHLADFHLRRGDSVLVLDDLTTGALDNLQSCRAHSHFQFIQDDLLTWSGLDQAVVGVDRIYHLAAVVGVHRVLEDPMRCMDVNIQGTRRVIDAVIRSERVIPMLIASSSEVYGFNRNASFYEEGSLVLRSSNYERWSYAISKLVDETIAAIAFKRSGLPLVTVRLFNTIGPRQRGNYGMVVPNFVQRAVAGKPLEVYGDGQQSRAFCDVRDTVRALVALLDSQNAYGRIVNVGHDQELTIEALAQRVIERAGSCSRIEFRSYQQAYGQDFKDIEHRAPDLSLLYQLIGFQHQWTLDDSLDDLIARARAVGTAVPAVTTQV